MGVGRNADLLNIFGQYIMSIYPHTRKSVKLKSYTVKTAHAVTSIKQSPVLKSHLFLVLSWINVIWLESLLRGHLSYKATFSLSKPWPLNTGLTVHVCHHRTYLTYILIHSSVLYLLKFENIYGFFTSSIITRCYSSLTKIKSTSL